MRENNINAFLNFRPVEGFDFQKNRKNGGVSTTKVTYKIFNNVKNDTRA